jgi:hypothetical protein
LLFTNCKVGRHNSGKYGIELKTKSPAIGRANSEVPVGIETRTVKRCLTLASVRYVTLGELSGKDGNRHCEADESGGCGIASLQSRGRLDH